MDGPLSVKKLAEIAAFSELHFQRIYSCFTGEPLYGFIKRLRLGLVEDEEKMQIVADRLTAKPLL